MVSFVTHHGMGLTTTVLTSKASQANDDQDPRARDRGQWLHDQQDNRRPRDSYQLMYDAPGRTRKNDEGHGETTSHRTADEPLPFKQCRHGQHYSTTPPHAATWAQYHNDNHVWMYVDAKTRRPALQAKIASFPSLRLTTAPSGELTLCMWPGLGL